MDCRNGPKLDDLWLRSAARRCAETKAFKVGIGFGVACAGLS
jgi:hypothetical protein